MFILSKLCPNNKFQIKRYRLAEGLLRAKNKGDEPRVAEQAKNGERLELLLANQKIAKFYSQLSQGGAGMSALSKSNSLHGCNPIETNSCVLPQTMSVYYPAEKGCLGYERQTSYQELASESALALGLLKKSQQSAKKVRSWGKKQREKTFRWQGGQKIKDGGAIIDRFVGKENATMLTVTLPGDSEPAKDAIARWSGWIVNRMLQVLRRVSFEDCPLYWFFVWEHQKRGALHLHFCLGVKIAREEREDLARRLKDKFYQCLLEILDKDGVDVFQRRGFSGTWRHRPDVWNWDIRQIEKSVAAYFAKYCEKNSRINGDYSGMGDGEKKAGCRQLYHPSRYWGSSSTVKQRARMITVEQKYEVCGDEEADHVISELRAVLSQGFDVQDVTCKDFQLEDEVSGVIWASGTVETYKFAPDEYCRFWLRLVDSEWCKHKPPDDFRSEMAGTMGYSSLSSRGSQPS